MRIVANGQPLHKGMWGTCIVGYNGSMSPERDCAAERVKLAKKLKEDREKAREKDRKIGLSIKALVPLAREPLQEIGQTTDGDDDAFWNKFVVPERVQRSAALRLRRYRYSDNKIASLILTTLLRTARRDGSTLGFSEEEHTFYDAALAGVEQAVSEYYISLQ